MVERTLPGLGLTGFWPLGANGYKDELDANIRILSALVNRNVKSRTTALPGTPTLGDIYVVPSGAGSNPNELAIWDGDSGAEAWVYLVPNEGWHFYVIDEAKNYQWDGTDWIEFAGGASGAPYDVRGGFTSTPGASDVLDTIMVVRDISFPADFSGSLGAIETNPASSFVISVQDDAVEFGTITIATDGAFTFVTTGNNPHTVLAGSQLTYIAPGSADANAADATWTLEGTA